MDRFEFGKNREEKIDKFLDNLAWYFSSKAISSPSSAIRQTAENLENTLREASESSKKLTEALNRITLAGVIIAGIGILIGIGNLSFEIWKYTHP